MDSGESLKRIELSVAGETVVAMREQPKSHQHQGEGKGRDLRLDPRARRVHCMKSCVNFALCTRRHSYKCFTCSILETPCSCGNYEPGSPHQFGRGAALRDMSHLFLCARPLPIFERALLADVPAAPDG